MSLCLYLPKSGPDRASHWFPGLCCFWNPVLTLALRHSLQQWDGSSTHIHSTLQLHDFSSSSPSDCPLYSILGSHSGATPLPSHQVRQLHFQNCGFGSLPFCTHCDLSSSFRFRLTLLGSAVCPQCDLHSLFPKAYLLFPALIFLRNKDLFSNHFKCQLTSILNSFDLQPCLCCQSYFLFSFSWNYQLPFHVYS